MATSQLAITYTDERYLTKKGIAEDLGTSLIEPIWSQVQSYRLSKSKTLPLKNLANRNFTLCLSEGNLAKFDQFERKLLSLSSSYVSLFDADMKGKFDRSALLNCLKPLSSYLGLGNSDLVLKAMINKMHRGGDEKEAKLVHYLSGLLSLHENYLGVEPNEDSLYEIKKTVYGKEPSSYYRLYDLPHRGARNFAPFMSIEDCMSSLWAFLSSNERLVAKLAGAYFYLDYLHPFEEGNLESACLLAKTVAAKEDLGQISALIPFEALISKEPRWDEIVLESNRSADLTYACIRMIEVLSPLIDEMLNLIVKIKKDAYVEETRSIPKEEKVEIKKDEPIEIKPEPKKEEIKEIVVEKEEKTIPIVPVIEGEIALSAPKSTLSEKEIKETAKYILQTNPSIRKPQALFFASHCSIGHYYTIQDYKKATRCAYETARTSMDNLAAEGFYKKLQIKNKFVYTPIKQGEIQ